MKIDIYSEGDEHIWLPVSQKKKNSPPRVFLPIRGTQKKYTHGFKSDSRKSTYFKAIAAVQSAYIHKTEKEFVVNNGKRKEKQKACKWRHGNALLGPTMGWIKVPISDLEIVSEEELTSFLEKSGLSATEYRIEQTKPEIILCSSYEELAKEVEKLYPTPVGEVPKGRKRPKRTARSRSVHLRDAVVVAYVLTRSNGICESCNEPAPFKKENGIPFLEVHHIKQLADNGSDRHSNAVAVCPNCHRELHYGNNRKTKVDALFASVSDLERE